MLLQVSQFLFLFWYISSLFFSQILRVVILLEISLWALKTVAYCYVYSAVFIKNGCGKVVVSERWKGEEEKNILEKLQQ